MKEYLNSLGILASFIGVICLINSENIFYILGKYLLLCIVLILIGRQLYNDYARNKQKIMCKSEKEINEFMYNWISTPGVTTIFSRDMSWANDSKINLLLSQKAKNKELKILVQDNDERLEELKEYGANIYYYNNLNYIPSSRFTIIRSNKLDSEVAIGRSKDDVHTIEKFTKINDDNEFHIANDMVSFLINSIGMNSNENKQ